MDKIKMTTPLVEMDGDEMTRILWKMIKDELVTPFIDLKTEYYDLGLEERNRTNDQESNSLLMDQIHLFQIIALFFGEHHSLQKELQSL